jgi:hypothetical protein
LEVVAKSDSWLPLQSPWNLAGTSRLGGGDSDGSLLDPAGSALLVSEEGSEAAAAPSHLPQAITQRRRGGEAELAAVGVEG